jgi:hypothetical protein
MKTVIKTMTGLALMTLLAGCVVTSVYPFYTAKDVQFDPALLGTWAEAGSTNAANDHWRFDRLNQQAYWLTIGEQNETNRYETHRFHLKQHVFLDLCTTNRMEDHLPLHYLMKLENTGSKLQVKVLNFAWLAKLLEKKPKALRHILVPNEPGNTNNNQLVLTADTPELQKFILKHINDTNAFGDATELTRWKD